MGFPGIQLIAKLARPLAGIPKGKQMQLARKAQEYLLEDAAWQWATTQQEFQRSMGKDFNIKPSGAHNLLRPETVKNFFLMWRVTTDSIYREWGWEISESLRSTLKSMMARATCRLTNSVPR